MRRACHPRQRPTSSICDMRHRSGLCHLVRAKYVFPYAVCAGDERVTSGCRRATRHPPRAPSGSSRRILRRGPRVADWRCDRSGGSPLRPPSGSAGLLVRHLRGQTSRRSTSAQCRGHGAAGCAGLPRCRRTRAGRTRRTSRGGRRGPPADSRAPGPGPTRRLDALSGHLATEHRAGDVRHPRDGEGLGAAEVVRLPLAPGGVGSQDEGGDLGDVEEVDVREGASRR